MHKKKREKNRLHAGEKPDSCGRKACFMWEKSLVHAGEKTWSVCQKQREKSLICEQKQREKTNVMHQKHREKTQLHAGEKPDSCGRKP